MTCTKTRSSCRISAESCDCCTCTSTPITENICEPCLSHSISNHPHPHHHEGCSCVHPVIICACNSCTGAEKDDTCHGHHAAPVTSLEEKKF